MKVIASFTASVKQQTGKQYP